jgi:ATP-dependent Clp protease ATP-binding subunit ClpB
MGMVRAHFRPEFLNRLDEIVLFERLSREHMAGIVDIQLRTLTARLAERKVTLDVGDEARAWLADRGYDPVYGARPLKRVIQKAVQDPLAELILSGALHDGDTVPVTVGPDGLLVGDRLVPPPGAGGEPPRATVH